MVNVAGDVSKFDFLGILTPNPAQLLRGQARGESLVVRRLHPQPFGVKRLMVLIF